jgi:hypothetical protein
MSRTGGLVVVVGDVKEHRGRSDLGRSRLSSSRLEPSQ